MNDYIFKTKNGDICIQANSLKEAKRQSLKHTDIIKDAYVEKVKKVNNGVNS